MKTITTLGLAALIGLSACSSKKIDNSPIEFGRGRPRQAFRLTSYNNKDYMFDGSTNHLAGYDLNGDRIVDEALIVNIDRYDGMGFLYVENLGYSVSRNKWKHLLADDVRSENAYLITPNTRTMTQQERDSFTEMLRYQSR